MSEDPALAPERAFLASALLDDRGVHGAAEAVDSLEEADFTDLDHRVLLGSMHHLRREGQPINVATMTVAMAAKGLDRSALLELVGRAELPATAANAAHYAQIVRANASRRRLKGLRVTELVDGAETPHDAIAAIRAELDAVERRACSPAAFDTGAELASATLARIDAAERGDVGLSTGLGAIDRAVGGGLQPGRLYVLAARTSIGKSALATCIAASVTFDRRQRTLLYSLEMPRAEVAERIVSARTGIPHFRLSTRSPAVHRCLGELSDAPLSIRDTRPSIRQLAAEVWSFHRTVDPVRLLIVDYLQLLQPARQASQRTKNDEVAEMSAELKALAMRLGAPILALAQMNRNIEHRGPDAAPTLADLRDSGAIEQDADVVAFLRRDGWDPAKADAGPMKIDVLKSRGGALGYRRLWNDGPTYRFSDEGPTSAREAS